MAKGYKTGGRKRGVPNKITSLVRESLSKYVQDILNTIDINKLEDSDKIKLALGVMQYIIPKQKAIQDLKSIEPREVTIQFVDAQGNVKSQEEIEKEKQVATMLDDNDYELSKTMDNIIWGDQN